MKKILFTSTALAAMAFGGVASAQGISLFGDARLGLGYNIANNGSVLLETNDDGDIDTADDVRAISRVRFGVNMSGVTDSGITFGATIRADNAAGGQGGTNGQTAGNVFVSGDWGTLTFGDTAGADEFFVGDTNGVGLTGLGDQNETPFVSNGGGFGSNSTQNFANNPTARPTVRYNIDIAGFGLALSSNRDLTDVQVGLGYNGEFGNSTFSVGAGYNDFEEFEVVSSADFGEACLDAGLVTVGGCTGPGVTILVPGLETVDVNSGGEQWSGAIGGSFMDGLFDAKVVYTQLELDDGPSFDWGSIGVGSDIGEFRIDAYYSQIMKASGFDAADDLDGLRSYGLGATYDLGGGARVEGGVASVYNIGAVDDGFIVADFGIGMSF